SSANDAQQGRTAEIVRAEWPEAAVTASHELTSEWREFDRTSTAVLDAYVKPTAGEYLERLGDLLERDAGIPARVSYAMQSNGGVSRFERARGTPSNLLESGPVGGVSGAGAIGRRVGAQSQGPRRTAGAERSPPSPTRT